MTDGRQLRAGTWNILCGGLGPDGSENRLRKQTEVLAALRPDVLALQECSYGGHQGECRLLGLADALGMTPVAMEPSRVGDSLNFTALLYRREKPRLVDRRRPAAQIFHHALIRARFRPVDAGDDSRDLLVLATHLSHAGGTARLAEVGSWLTDHAGDFPGAPRRSILMGDLNCSGFHDPDPDWSSEPPTLYARCRLVNEDGTFGAMDRRAIRMLLDSGWEDPQARLREERAATGTPTRKPRWGSTTSSPPGTSRRWRTGRSIPPPPARRPITCPSSSTRYSHEHHRQPAGPRPPRPGPGTPRTARPRRPRDRPPGPGRGRTHRDRGPRPRLDPDRRPPRRHLTRERPAHARHRRR
ncbi:endonuclease/exonuclease/phosphatase family protein (plasmid) [Streptomyces clavuligerus]|uniref:Endonuclease/exonuclease/phosphatase n=1 Tax=Streptomyces clavuligerus TaxID=1901 RepID=B5GUI0_STRCL|nr:hypothetical protein SSCG_03230 [Streptomyces clavuligerus]EFG03690.1 Endonuclease/exonuclease/phosphatase [Streptomyces clavuligerus]MBY6307762.1 endonuclease/exonuclease/phosphatase family protein [Streptomyces clavuligerus]QCS09693.1 endonuclease/exonuclease/phosphatase family protein [Streptomyces clavuligerus]